MVTSSLDPINFSPLVSCAPLDVCSFDFFDDFGALAPGTHGPPGLPASWNSNDLLTHRLFREKEDPRE